ncbi:hypothetical protein ACIBP6_35525 [Nonomuraea terrae]|uniref:hypothetical protein n=1 Tax=Nonomuraea terrae TaxID=2530383 RepID=UPI0037ABCEBD
MSAVVRALPALVALPLLTAPSPAYAATEISCRAAGNAHFLPGVQMSGQSQHVTYRGTQQDCIDHSALGITAVRFSAEFEDVDLACVDRDFGRGTGTATLQWRLGQAKPTSTADVTIEDTTANRVTMWGVVREGAFEGRRFRGAFDTSLLGGAGRCEAGALFGGVRSAPFEGSFSID